MVDLVGFRVLKTLKVGRGPFAVAVAPSGTRAYVTNAGARSVSIVDAPAAARREAVRARRPVGGIAVLAGGRRAVVGAGQALAQGDRARHQAPPLRQADRGRQGTGRRSRSLPTGARIYFANGGSGTITFASGYTLRRLPGRVRVGRRIVGDGGAVRVLPDRRHARPRHPEGRPRAGPDPRPRAATTA